MVHGLPSLQLVPVSGVTVQLDVPLQVRVLHWSEAHVTELPTQTPLLLQLSFDVQALPSSQAVPVRGVTVQDDVPLRARLLHWSEVQVIAVPTHVPLLLHASLYVHALPSLQAVPVRGVTVQDDVPLQVRVSHRSEVHVIGVPAQTPLLLHASL